MSEIQHTKAYNTAELTISFWIFLLSDSISGFRTILHKGEVNEEKTPTIMLWGGERRLHLLANTETTN